MQINFLNKMIWCESLTQRLKGVEFDINKRRSGINGTS
jgi:hypothetical protein